MFGSIIKVFFGNILVVLGVIIIIGGGFGLVLGSTPVGIGMIVFGILLVSISTVLKRHSP